MAKRRCRHKSNCGRLEYCDHGVYICRSCYILCDERRRTQSTCQDVCPEYWRQMNTPTMMSQAVTDHNIKSVAAKSASQTDTTRTPSVIYLIAAVLTAVLTVLVVLVAVCVHKWLKRKKKMSSPKHDISNVERESLCGSECVQNGNSEAGNRTKDSQPSSKISNSSEHRKLSSLSNNMNTTPISKSVPLDINTANWRDSVKLVNEHRKRSAQTKTTSIVVSDNTRRKEDTESPAKMSNVICSDKDVSACERNEFNQGMSDGCEMDKSAECKGSEIIEDIVKESNSLSLGASHNSHARYSQGSVISMLAKESGSLDDKTKQEIMESIQMRGQTDTSLHDQEETSLKQRCDQVSSDLTEATAVGSECKQESAHQSQEMTPAKKVHKNKEIYNILRCVDFVQGYFSQGNSIEVYVNLHEVDADIALTEIMARTGAAKEKFKLVHESGNY